MFNIGDIVYFNMWSERDYGIVVGFTHNDYYYIDWFDRGCDWLSPYHASTISPVEASEGT